MHKPRQRSGFTKAALKTLESIGTLEQFLMKHKKDYVDLHRTTEQERDRIEHEVTIFVKSCKEQIDVLRNSINEEDANSKGWLGLKGDNFNADTIAYKHGVVWKHKNTTKSNAAETPVSSSLDPDMKRDSEVRDTGITSSACKKLNSLLDSVQETETKMVEMSALNHLMSTHVLQQAQQIELLYEQAVEATQNVELGNKELSQAIQRNSSSRTFLLLFLFVLTFSILFLDWYS
ncbi:hypothetical protein K7X08_016794 [Anisodus acutangulus]|uniref:SNARE-complex protein Syntaxin-18 N-terminal domain-containing protein n=1 Tax=Anisodus acutangulus TaxID=402998 RepID=A0A9Q1LU38_9SOLA|nr:hypothetical protein K7X08_016794 [Anisodus acutangulus]